MSIANRKQTRVIRTEIQVKMSGKIGDEFYCSFCDVKLQGEQHFETHCQGRRHKTNERIRSEQEAAACSLLVRGARGCKDVEQLLASHFCQFGLLANVSPFGTVNSGLARVKYVEAGAVEKALQFGKIHQLGRLRLRVQRFEYRPQVGDVMRLSHKEEVSRHETSNADLHASVCRFLGGKSLVSEQIQAITEKLQLTQEDVQDRQAIVEKLTEVFAPSHPGCSVHQFGSSMNGFGMQGCDLDLFLNFGLSQSNKEKKLRKLSKILSSRGLSSTFSDVQQIPSQRCPIIKLAHKPTGIKCDLSLNNKKALLNSQLLRLYSTDQRVLQMVFVLRLWAKFRRLSRSDAASESFLLSSYALTLLAIFYLTQGKPEPVVPAVCDLPKCVSGISVETVEECQCLVIPEGAQLPPSKNSQSSVELLQGFFQFYSQDINFERDALLLREAKTSPRATVDHHYDYVNCRIGPVTVVDPFNLSHNVTANLTGNLRRRLVSEMKRAAELSASWLKSGSFHSQEEAPLSGLAGLFELASPDVNKKPAKHGKSKKGGTASKEARTYYKKETEAKSAGTKRKLNAHMQGEQENGEFHIVLFPSRKTLESKQLAKGAGLRGVTPIQHWFCKARELTCTVLKEVFLAEVEEEETASCCETQMEVEEDGEPGSKGKWKRRASHDVSVGTETENAESPSLRDEMERGFDKEEMPKKKMCCGSLLESASSSFPSVSTVPAPTFNTQTSAESCASAAMTPSAMATSNSVESTASNSACVTPAAEKKQIMSLVCTCRHEIWFGRKQLNRSMECFDKSGNFVVSLAAEKELTRRVMRQHAWSVDAQNSPAGQRPKRYVVINSLLRRQSQMVGNFSDKAKTISDSRCADVQHRYELRKRKRNVSGTVTSNNSDNDGDCLVSTTEGDAVVGECCDNVAVAPGDFTTGENGTSVTAASGWRAVPDTVLNLNTPGGERITGKNIDGGDTPVATSENGTFRRGETVHGKIGETVSIAMQDNVATGSNDCSVTAAFPGSHACANGADFTTTIGNHPSGESRPGNGDHQNEGLSSASQRTLSNSACSSPPSNTNNPPSFFLEFSCDLIMSCGDAAQQETDGDGPSHSYFLIRLRPSQSSCRGQFKKFYDPFRSIMVKLAQCELQRDKMI